MKLNADISQRVVIHSEDIPWVESPIPGVQRRMLERDGEELRNPSGSRHTPFSREGCLIYVKTGHLN